MAQSKRVSEQFVSKRKQMLTRNRSRKCNSDSKGPVAQLVIQFPEQSLEAILRLTQPRFLFLCVSVVHPQFKTGVSVLLNSTKALVGGSWMAQEACAVIIMSVLTE